MISLIDLPEKGFVLFYEQKVLKREIELSPGESRGTKKMAPLLIFLEQMELPSAVFSAAGGTSAGGVDMSGIFCSCQNDEQLQTDRATEDVIGRGPPGHADDDDLIKKKDGFATPSKQILAPKSRSAATSSSFSSLSAVGSTATNSSGSFVYVRMRTTNSSSACKTGTRSDDDPTFVCWNTRRLHDDPKGIIWHTARPVPVAAGVVDSDAVLEVEVVRSDADGSLDNETCRSSTRGALLEQHGGGSGTSSSSPTSKKERPGIMLNKTGQQGHVVLASGVIALADLKLNSAEVKVPIKACVTAPAPPATLLGSIVYALSPNRKCTSRIANKGARPPQAQNDEEQCSTAAGDTTTLNSTTSTIHNASVGAVNSTTSASSAQSTSERRGTRQHEKDAKTSTPDEDIERLGFVTLKRLDPSSIPSKRTVYLVRHGESLWNQAQDSGQFWRMPTLIDAPLSAAGVEQCRHLAAEVVAKEEGLGLGLGGRAAGRAPGIHFFCSPLTRALQTALIGFEKQLVGGAGTVSGSCSSSKKKTKMTLMPSAREKKTSFASVDTLGTEVGPAILEKVKGTLAEQRLSCLDEGKMNVENEVAFDLSQVQHPWWTEWADGEKALDRRLEEFRDQLIYAEQEADDATRGKVQVVVGHSHFFREFFRKFLSEDSETESGLLRDLRKKKLSNAGMARVELELCGEGTTLKRIVNVQLCGDTCLIGDEGLGSKCKCDGGSVDVPGEPARAGGGAVVTAGDRGTEIVVG